MPLINIVLGAPCAGKSSFVEEKARNEDLKVDFDKLALSLGSVKSHESRGAVRGAAFAARSAVIEYAIKGIESDAWIIHTSPQEDQLARYEAVGAVFHVLDPGREICIARSIKDGRPDGTVDAINSWYSANEKTARRFSIESQLIRRIQAVTA